MTDDPIIAKGVQVTLKSICLQFGIVIYANDSTHLVTVETTEGQELFSFGSVDSGEIEGLVEK